MLVHLACRHSSVLSGSFVYFLPICSLVHLQLNLHPGHSSQALESNLMMKDIKGIQDYTATTPDVGLHSHITSNVPFPRRKCPQSHFCTLRQIYILSCGWSMYQVSLNDFRPMLGGQGGENGLSILCSVKMHTLHGMATQECKTEITGILALGRTQ